MSTHFDEDKHRRDTAGKFAPGDASRDEAGQVLTGETPPMKETVRATLETLRDRPHPVLQQFLSGDIAPPKGTCRKWFREGDEVDTLQFRVNSEGRPSGPWAPGHRIVEDVSASGATMSGSKFEFDGTRVISADDKRLISFSDWGPNEATVAIHIRK